MQARFDYKALYAALDKKKRSRGLSWAQVAREIGGRDTARHRISPSTITKTSRGGPMEADGVLAMARWVGSDLATFVVGANLPSPRKKQGVGLLRFDTRALFLAIDSRRLEQRMTWHQVASQVGGSSPGMLRRLEGGGRMGIDQVVFLSRWLGKAPEDFARMTRS